MTKTVSQRDLADIIRCPLITEKATRLMENNQYTFDVALKATKPEIKAAVEAMFEVKVVSVQTLRKPLKKKRVGRFVGYKAQYKRAIVRLADGDSIDLFPDV
ncbi:50S ribosomal protein L23 [Geitlerinema sp. CS-897]|uniref:50S ribosomal protein L23 n=1 Tax=Baaleninema simplex TaxID=2862350 RepID=UPI00037E03F8|nr:50S ribosomal protein L23 [Baaleninema simplex]MDC0835144.1 50S ribosomal protein L23 [Geitlerinema sp. CS-897]